MIMSKKRVVKKEILFISVLIFVILSLTTVLAGNVIVKGGFMTVEDGFNVSDFFFVDSSGNVGIGTTTPAYLFQVGSHQTAGTATASIKSDTNHRALYLEENSGGEGWQLGVSAAGDLGFHDSGAASASITFKDGGNVGIGTTNPETKLNVLDGQITNDESNQFAVSKFNSQGVTWATDVSLPSLIFNANANIRPEIAWIRGARTYPEFVIRQHANADSGATIYSGTGLVVPTATMSFVRGQVGIGTITPGAKLEIYSPTNIADEILLKINQANRNRALFFGVDTSEASIQAATSNFATPTSLLLNPDGGNVGIGTTNPAYPLEVLGSAEGVIASFRADVGGRHQGLYIDTDIDSPYTTTLHSSGTSAGDLAFATGNDVRMTIESDGNVGIGTTNPGATLEINGDGAQNILNISREGSVVMFIDSIGEIGIGTTTPAGPLEIQKTLSYGTEGPLLILDSANSGPIAGASIQFRNSGAGYIAAIAGIDDAAWDGRLEFRVSNDGSATGSPLTSSDTVMTIDQTGEVGIGDTTPDSTLDAVGVYSDTVGGTRRDVYVDNTGIIGYISSSERYKENINDLVNTNWLYDLRPVTFKWKSNGDLDVGLIAEEVELVQDKLVSYDFFELIDGEYVIVNRAEYEDYSVLDRELVSQDTWEVTLERGNETITKQITKLPETVEYDKLIVPMLKELQDMKAENDLMKQSLCGLGLTEWC